ncbi:TetR/AcrR family transcriptional regulator [Mycoplasmatota bacterium WC44]
MYHYEKVDTRVKFTRECVFTALNKLIQKKSFESITINELVEVSGISRATFYRNYSSKEEIIEKKLNQVITDSFKEMLDEYKGKQVTNAEAVSIMFIIIKENESLLECIKHAKVDSLILQELSTILSWYASHYYKDHIKNDIEFDYII